MASTYSNLKIQLMATGENNTTWGNVTNINLGTALEEAITGSVDVPFSSANVTLTLTDTNTTQPARNLRLKCTGTTAGARNLVVPAIEKLYLVTNGCADAITVKNATGTGIAVPASASMWVFNDATNVLDAVSYMSSLTLGAALPVASGGTGQTTYTNGQLLIGNTTGSTLTKATLTAGSGVSITNGTGAITISATGSGGSVTSVNGAGGTTGLTLTGGPITTTGTLTLGGTLGVASGGTNVASYTIGDILYASATTTLSKLADVATGSAIISGGVATAPAWGKIGLATHVSGTLPVANGGTGAATYTNGQLLIGNTTGNTLTPATLTAGTGVTITNGTGTITISSSSSGGTVTSVNGSGGTTGLTLTGGAITTSGTLTLGGTLAVANGGTGATSFTNGQLLIGNTTGNTLTAATLTAGTGVTITNGTGTITISSSGGTVTSVNGSGGTTGLTLTGGAITTSGTLTLGGTLATANGGTNLTGFTAANNAIYSTSSSVLTAGTLPITAGGTGATSASAARTALSAAASGANTDITALDQDVTVTATGTIAANTIGYRGLPQSTKTASYTLALADAGTHISTTTGGIVIPANSSVAFPIGTAITIFNNSASSQTLSITTDTLRLAGTSSTGSRTISLRGLCTCLKVNTTEWVASGAGVS
jgi:hypothetical protein